MKVKQSPIAAAVTLTLLSVAMTAQAQTAPKAEANQLEQVVVTGIRASQEKSLSVKKNSAMHVEVITAEDIGKMPDKNIADSLQRIPGVAISSASGAEGGFDENDKVSMRGTGPSLTQTLVDGHNVAGGEWFILNQTGESGRSVSYTLLPAEIVGQVVVNKSSEASLIEGGTTGSINIKTRKPLDAKANFSFDANVGAVYSTLPKKTDPQLSAVLGWKNEAKNFGIIVQAFSEKRHLRRDGIEVLGYEAIKATDGKGIANPIVTKWPDLAGKKAPSLIGKALFEQERERTGGLVKAQLKLSNDFSLEATAYSAELKANNYNRNYMLWGSRLFNGNAPGWAGDTYVQFPIVPTTKPTVVNGIVTSADFADQKATPAGIYDMISRPKSGSKTSFFDLDANWNVNDKLSIAAKAGATNGSGYTATQDVMELDVFGPASYTLNGASGVPKFTVGGDPQAKSTYTNDWIWGDNSIKVKDKEAYGQIDGSYALADEGLRELKFGVRATSHTRSMDDYIGQGPKGDWDKPAAFDLPSKTPYPGSYSYAGNTPAGVWYYTPEQLAAYGDKFANRDPKTRTNYGQLYKLVEKTTAAYLQADFGSGKLSGNAGVRVVKTTQTVDGYTGGADGSPANPEKTSDWGKFVSYNKERSYTDYLPSLNLRYADTRDLIYRASLTRTMTRPDYSVIAGGVSLDSRNVNKPTDIGTGSSPNFNIDPVRSTNFDVAAEWYFAPRSMASVSVFYMKMDSLITGGKTKGVFMTEKPNPVTGGKDSFLATYELQSFANDKGDVKGFELAYEQPLFGNFGVNANMTYTDAKRDGGKPMTGASKNTYNLGGFFENDNWNARLAYSYRSEFLTGNDWTGNAMYALGTASVSASLGYKVTSNFSVQFDARNLNNPELKYYTDTKEQPRATYFNGRQFYLSARMKF